MKGFHVVVDNFFTSVDLAHELFKRHAFLTGTLRRNRKNTPQGLKEKFSEGDVKYYRNGEILILGQREKKTQKNPVLLLSTKATANTSLRKNRHGKTKEIVRPQIIDLYNKYMGGIDTSDMMVYV
jgi:hypothetical protein